MISSILRCLHYYYHYHYYYNHHYFHHKNPFTEWKEIGVINIDNDNPHFISSDDNDNDNKHDELYIIGDHTISSVKLANDCNDFTITNTNHYHASFGILIFLSLPLSISLSSS